MCNSYNVQWPEFFVAEDDKPNLIHEHLLEVYGEAMAYVSTVQWSIREVKEGKTQETALHHKLPSD